MILSPVERFEQWVRGQKGYLFLCGRVFTIVHVNQGSANKNISSPFQILGQRADMIIVDDVEAQPSFSKMIEYCNNDIAKAMGISDSLLKPNIKWETTVKPLQAITNTIGVIRSDIKS